MSTPRVRLGGVDLSGYTSYAWPLKSGVDPHEEVFVTTTPRAERLAAQIGKPLTLELVGPRASRRVEKLYVIEILSAGEPHLRGVRVVDKRRWWPYPYTASTLNLRRATGDFTLLADGQGPENFQVTPDVEWAGYSLSPPENPSRPWDLRGMLRLAFRRAGEPSIRMPKGLPAVDVEDLIFDDNGRNAIERALAYIPGYSVYMDDDGVPVIYNQTDSAELGILEKVKKRQQARQVFAVAIDRRGLRPRHVEVLFTPEVECRFDYDESGSASQTKPGEARLVPQVMITDPELEISGRKVAQGSLEELNAALFTAWGKNEFTQREFGLEVLRRGHASQFQLMEESWVRGKGGFRDQVWAKRIAAAKDAYRSLFSLDPDFLARLESVQDRRVAVLNTINTQEALAPVFCDVLRKPTMLGLARGVNDPNIDAGYEVRSHSSVNTNVADMTQAPASLELVKGRFGYVRIRPHQSDLLGNASHTILGRLATLQRGAFAGVAAIPKQSPFMANRTGEEVFGRWAIVALDPNFVLTTILTVIPGSPNDEGRFYKQVISPRLAGVGLGRPGGFGPCLGPVKQVRVMPGVMPARFAYTDDTRDQVISKIKGETDAWPEKNLINRRNVQNVAVAAAANVYQTMLDSVEGSAVIDMDPSIKPAGSVGTVDHVVDGTTGETVTRIDFEQLESPLSLWRFLDSSTRRAILGSLHRGVR